MLRGIYMNKIVVKNSHIEIHDYEFGDCTKLENNFRIWDRVRFENYYIGMHYDVENKVLYLPRALDIYYVEACFRCTAFIDRQFNTYDYVDQIRLRSLPRDDVQKQALRFMCGIGEYKDNETKSQLGLYLNTGKGKTYTSIATMSYYSIKSIIITYSVSWLEQWKSEILKYTDLQEKDICMISGSGTIRRLMARGSDKYKVFLVTHSTIASYCKAVGWDKLNDLFISLKVGLKFYDEAHLNFVNISMIDFYTNVYKTFYITATPARSSEEEKKIYSLYFKNTPSIDLFDEEVDPHTKYIAMKFNSCPTADVISMCKNAYGLDRNRYMDWLSMNDEFYKMLRVIMNICLRVEGKCLFYIGTNTAIERVYEWLCYNYPFLIGNIGIFTSLTPQNEKEEQKNKKIILSTTKSFGASVDCKGLKITVVLDEPFKSEVLARQSLGRTRDENTMYIDLIDMGFIPLRRFYVSKRPIFEKYATDVSEININKNDLNTKVKSITGEPKPLIIINKQQE